MTESLVPVSGKTTTIISESPQARGPSNLSPNDKRLRTKPGAKSAAEAEFHRAQLQAVYENIADCGTDHDTEGKYSARLADVETFLERLKTKGIVDRKGGGHLAKMTQEQKKELLTLGLKRHTGQPYERDNARCAIISYADRHGHKEGLRFKRDLLKRCSYWVGGNDVEKRAFQFLGKSIGPIKPHDKNSLMPAHKEFTPENLEKLRVSITLERKLRSAGQKHPTLANLGPLLSLEDVTNLSEFDALFSKVGGSTPIHSLLHVAARGRNGVSDRESRQKIREVMLLATAKEATAAKAEVRSLNPETLKELKRALVEAAKVGPKELAKRYNEEMAKLAFQPGTHDAPGLGEIGKTSAEAQAYRTNFQASVEAWSENNQHRFIGLSKLHELSRMATAPIVNQGKLDAHITALKNNQVSSLEGKTEAFRSAYVKQLRFLVENEGNKKGNFLDDHQFQRMCNTALESVLFQERSLRNFLSSQ